MRGGKGFKIKKDSGNGVQEPFFFSSNYVTLHISSRITATIDVEGNIGI